VFACRHARRQISVFFLKRLLHGTYPASASPVFYLDSRGLFCFSARRRAAVQRSSIYPKRPDFHRTSGKRRRSSFSCRFRQSANTRNSFCLQYACGSDRWTEQAKASNACSAHVIFQNRSALRADFLDNEYKPVAAHSLVIRSSGANRSTNNFDALQAGPQRHPIMHSPAEFVSGANVPAGRGSGGQPYPQPYLIRHFPDREAFQWRVLGEDGLETGWALMSDALYFCENAGALYVIGGSSRQQPLCRSGLRSSTAKADAVAAHAA
jgi:hypothetical protein